MKSTVENGSNSAVERYKPYMVMVILQCGYAGMALFSKAAISKGMSPFVFVVYRQAFASLALAPFALFLERKKPPPLSYRLLCKIFLVSFIGLTLSLNLYNIGINNTTATFAAAGTNVIPALTFVMALLFRMETLSLKHGHGLAKVLGSVVGVSGALVYAFVRGPPLNFMQNRDHFDSETADKDSVKGSLIMISGFVFWSLWFVLQGPIAKEYPSKLRLTTLQCFFSCIQSAVGAIAIERKASAWKLGWDLHLVSVLYCGVIVSGIGYWVQVWTIEKKGPVFASSFTPLALIVAAFFSALLWKETLHWGSLGGSILLVGGLYAVLWGKQNEEQKDEEDKRAIKGPIANQDESITLARH